MGKSKTAKRSLRFTSPLSQFERKCRCITHDETIEYRRLFRTNGKEFEKQKLINLIDKKLISPKAKWVCSNCLCPPALSKNKSSVTQDNFDIQGDVKTISNSSSTLSESSNFETVVNALEKGLFTKEQLQTISSLLGKSISSDVANDINTLSGQYKDLKGLSDLNCLDYIQNRPKELVEFLFGLCDISTVSVTSKKLNAICHLIEQIYFCKNLNFIGPFSFSKNIIQYTFSGSKTCVALDGATSSAGSITSVKKVLKDSAKHANVCFPSGDIDIFFDNTQRVGKTKRVREGGSTPMDVATNVVFLQKCPESNVQADQTLSPGEWLSRTTDGLLELQNNCIENLNTYKRDIQGSILTNTSNEVSYDADMQNYNDHVSVKATLHTMGIEKNVCVKCSCCYEKTCLACPKCKHNMNFFNNRSTLYNDVPSQHPPEIPKIKMGEIVNVNPNSRETVKTVLKDILKQTSVGTTRQWIRVGCDGLPYTLADSLIDNLGTCSICKEEIDLKHESFELHVLSCHGGLEKENATFKKVFDRILLTPGAGHIEINLLRACFLFCKNIFIEHIAGLLGFCSKKAKEFIVSCGNHHVSWQIAMIIFHAFSMELCYSYIVHCFAINVEPCLHGFIEWKNSSQNVNIPFYYDLIFTIFLGLKCFRSGVRNNNSKYMLAGRQAASLLFFVGNHRIYRQLICRDLQIRMLAPPSVAEYLQSVEAFSASGDPTKGEGGDFITENQNRTLKHHLPPGVPTLQHWQTASRCDESLKNIRTSVFERSGLKDPSSEDTVTFNQDTEIQMLRREIRCSKLLMNTENNTLRALNGHELHHGLQYFLATANDNFKCYANEGSSCEMMPVFTTHAEEAAYNDISTWTIKKLASSIEQTISALADENLSSLFMDIYKQNVLKQNKASYISFLQEIRSVSEHLLEYEEETT